MAESLIYQIAITLVPGVGDINGRKLVAYCGGVEAVFKEKARALLKIPGIGKTTAAALRSAEVITRAEKEARFVERNRIRTVFYTDREFPRRLHHCTDAPMMLYAKGPVDLNNDRILSIVGTRSATEYGKEIVSHFIEGLSALNVLIVSGLAYGIDSCSHKEALLNNLPTAGVLAHGLDRIYPYANRSLAIRMIEKGGLVTEFISETNPDKENFPKRNRIIAGLADAVVVVEAGRKGGALITAEIANSYNRDVFAVPGRLSDEYSVGCNFLIKTNKASLVQSPEDIIYMMGWEKSREMTGSRQALLFHTLTPEEATLVRILGEQGECTIDWLSLHSRLTLGKVTSLLLTLEFKGIVKSLPGKIYKMG
ncbi:MAG: DNA-processing protein DprA [Bacteroidales bacterium]|nr:DNA-processing protein DprA [Lentimicrobiaceae bacterium]MDD5694282.1 DNA-processing protein DprA [Bacteroidales bacterium]